MEDASVDQHLKTVGDEEEEINFILAHDVFGDMFDIHTPLDDDDEEGSIELCPADMSLPYDDSGSHDGAPSLLAAPAATRDEGPAATTSPDRRSGYGAIMPRSPSAASTLPSAGPQTLEADAASSRVGDEMLFRLARRVPPQELQEDFKGFDSDRVAGISGRRPHSGHTVITQRPPLAANTILNAMPRSFDADAALPMAEDEKLLRLALDAPPQELQEDFKDFDFDRVAGIEDFDGENASLDVRGTPKPTPASSNRRLAPTMLGMFANDVLQLTQELDNSKDFHFGPISAEDGAGGSRPASLPRRKHSGAGEVHAAATPTRHSYPRPVTHFATAWTGRRAHSAPFYPVSLPPPVDLFPSAAMPPIVHLAPLPASDEPKSQLSKSMAAAREKHLVRVRKMDRAARRMRNAARARSQVVHVAKGPDRRDGKH